MWLVLTMPHLEHLRGLPELGVVAVAGVRGQYVTARTAFDAERVTMEVTRGDYAGVTRMRPLAGKLTGLSNDGAQAGPVAVISERLWREWFKADRDTPGRDAIRLNGTSFTVAGVAPASHSFRGTDIWIATESWRLAEPAVPDTFASAQVRFRAGSEPARLRPMIDLALASGPSPPTAEPIGAPNTMNPPLSFAEH
jgi:hypothetical protein